jgi:hypothetical protein
MGDVMMAACDAQNLASLLEAVSAERFKEASRTDDYRFKKWGTRPSISLASWSALATSCRPMARLSSWR